MNIFMSADCFYPSQAGGPSNTIYWQAKALTQAGLTVTVVATSQELPSSVPVDRWLKLACGRVIYTRNPHFYFPVKQIWYGWQAIRQADVIHVNSLFYPSSFVFVVMAQFLGKPVVWSPHGELSPYALSFSPLRKRFMLGLFRQISKRVTFHATSAVETTQVHQRFGRNTATIEIPNRMELPVQAERIGKPYLLFMGRLHPIKGIDRLLKALSESRIFRESPYTLAIAGADSNNYKQTLAHLGRTLNLIDKVHFVGAVRGQQKEQLYADALVTILPSYSENFGVIVIESLAQGTPVIASTGTPWEVLKTEKAGSWVSNEPIELKNAIESYLIMPTDIYQAYRKRAVSLANRQFDCAANVGEWVRVYESTAQKTALPFTTLSV